MVDISHEVTEGLSERLVVPVSYQLTFFVPDPLTDALEPCASQPSPHQGPHPTDFPPVVH